MRPAILIAIFLTIPAFCLAQTTWYVPDDFPTIQGAISDPLVVNGDTVIVRPNTYVENIDFIGKAIILKSEYGAEITTIDGNQTGSVITFNSGEVSDSVLDGFTLTNGNGTLVEIFPGISWEHGGGIFCSSSSPAIKNNIIKENLTYSGGGIYCESNSTPIITNNTIKANLCNILGGGIFLCSSSPIIINNTIQENSSGSGGGIEIVEYSSPIIENNIIISNHADSYGAGIYCHKSSPTLENNIILGNSTNGCGGGVHCSNSSPLITKNTIGENKASGHGSGINCESYSSPVIMNNYIYGNSANIYGGGVRCHFLSEPTIIGNIIRNNSAFYNGGGIYVSDICSPKIINNTIYGNIVKDTSGHGGGIYCNISIIINTIIWNNQASIGPEIYHLPGNPPEVIYCDIKGGWPGTGNIDTDPLFVDPSNNDYHLLYISPCKNMGDNYAPGLPDKDLEGDPRIAYDIVDMGADEYYTHLYYTGDAFPNSAIDVKTIGLPDEEVILYLGNGILDPPIATNYGDWYLQLPVTHFMLGSTPWKGMISLHARIPPACPTPLSIPLQALVRDELTNLCVLEIE